MRSSKTCVWLIAVLLAGLSYAGNTVLLIRGSGGGGGGGGCETQSQVLSIGSLDHIRSFDLATQSTAQTVQFASDYTLYSVSVYFYGWPSGETVEVTLRIGSTSDLTSPLASATITEAGGSNPVIKEFVFDSGSRPDVTASTTYYIGFVKGTGTGSGRAYRDPDSGDYTGGAIYIGDSATDWTFEDAGEAGDVRLTVKACD